MLNTLKECIKAFESASYDNHLKYGGALYFTKNPANNDARYKGKKYFICHATHHKIVAAFKTQKELVEYLEQFGH